MHRFYVPARQISCGRAYLVGDQLKQIRNVLRLAPGDEIVLFDGSGSEYVGRIQTLDKQSVTAVLVESRKPATEPAIRVTLALSVLKGQSMDFALQKCTEIGAAAFVIVGSSRTVPHIPEERVSGRLERWRAIVREAAEQSGRVVVPAVDGVYAFADALARVHNQGARLILWEGEREEDLSSLLRDAPGFGDVSLFVGPEGGFTAEEVRLAETSGVKSVSLGPRVLRAETAAVVGTALVLYCWGRISVPEAGKIS